MLFVLITIWMGLHHELWGDEIHSWNIAKASDSLSLLLDNTKYEGHPPLWYVLLWVITRFTADPAFMEAIHLLIAVIIVFLVLFYSPLPRLFKALVPFGYFFLFEYAQISRNYSVGILLALILCIIIHKEFKGRFAVYLLILFLISNSHLQSLLMAGSIHVYYLLYSRNKNLSRNQLFIQGLSGFLILLPAAFFIYPPADSALNPEFWRNQWNWGKLAATTHLPLRAFLPIPAWWEDHFWNTQFLLAISGGSPILKYLNPLISFVMLGLAFRQLKSNKNCLAFYFFLVVSLLFFSLIIPSSNARFAGYLYVGLIIALWLFYAEKPPGKRPGFFLFMIFLLQIAGAAIAVSQDLKRPFSNAGFVSSMLKKVPYGNPAVTDYWCLNNLSAYINKPFYCVDFQKEKTFLRWDQEMSAMLKKKNRYSDGIKTYMRKMNTDTVYMISIQSPEKINSLDRQLNRFFSVKLIDQRTGAIEKGGDLYLYIISSPSGASYGNSGKTLE